MFKSEMLKSLGPALLKAQSLMGGAVKGSSNPYFKSKYADLGSVLEACKELLNSNGVIILQPHGKNELGTYVETILLHAESGEYISSVTPVVFAKEGDPQAQGSAITYARRYGLQSLLSMPAEDDDGEKAMFREKKQVPVKAEAPKTDVPVTETTPKPRTTFRKPSPKVEETVTAPLSNGNASNDDLGLN